MSRPSPETVFRFNRLKANLLAWKHFEECDNKELYPQGMRDEDKREFEGILKKYPDINDIMPSFYCTICNPNKDGQNNES